MREQRLRIGDLVVQAGLISREKLEAALKNRPFDVKIGEYLVQKGLIKEEDMVAAVCHQTGIERYEAERFPIDFEIAQKIPADLADKYAAVPLLSANSVLYVAMINPLDINALDSLELLVNSEVDAVMCLRQEFYMLYTLVYGSYSNAKENETLTAGLELEAPSNGAKTPFSAKPNDELNLRDITSSDAPAVRLVNSILTKGVQDGVSDIHINPEKDRLDIRFRIDGRLRKLPSVPANIMSSVISRLKILSNMDISQTRIPQDGRFTMRIDGREINVRMSSVPTIYGENIVMRLLDMSAKKIMSLKELGMNEDGCDMLKKYAHRPHGLILSTGPTGSGKSTSLYAILQEVNRVDNNTMTLEDPVEYRIAGIRQIQLNERAGMTFAAGLRSILRQDPDILMIGEIRDEETARTAIQAALTGHLVLSSLHTNDATGTISRLIDMGIEPYLVSSVLLCSFAQRLVRLICPHCREEYTPDVNYLQAFGLRPEDGPFYHGSGCPYCGNTGYAGRTAVFEIMNVPTEMQQAISAGATPQELRALALKSGMKPLAEHAAEKIKAGLTTVEEAARVIIV